MQRESRTEWRLELTTGVLLGLAAVATAWAAFQASVWDGRELQGYTEASLNISEAGTFFAQADRTMLEDQLIFLEWATAAARDDTALARFIREEMMSRRLQNAISAWERSPDRRETSVFDPAGDAYSLPALETGREFLVRAKGTLVSGQEAGDRGDQFNLVTVLVAASLFVAGISSTFDVVRIRMATLAISASILVGACAWMFTLPMRLS